MTDDTRGRRERAQALRKSNDELQATLAAREASIETMGKLNHDNFEAYKQAKQQLTAAVQRAEQAEARVRELEQRLTTAQEDF